MGGDWVDWDRPRGLSDAQCELAAQSLAAHQSVHFLATEPSLGGGLSLSQLHRLQDHLTGRPPWPSRNVRWSHWAPMLLEDSGQASRSRAWVAFVAQVCAKLGRVDMRAQDSSGAKGKGGKVGKGEKTAGRLSPRTLLEFAASSDPPAFRYDADELHSQVLKRVSNFISPYLEGQTAEPSEPSPWASRLEACLQATLPLVDACIWEALRVHAEQRLINWTMSYVRRMTSSDCIEPVVVIGAGAKEQATAVALDADGRCCRTTLLSSERSEEIESQLRALASSVGGRQFLVASASSSSLVTPVLQRFAAAGTARWRMVNCLGARTWARLVSVITRIGETAAVREAVFLGRRHQRPLETVAEMRVVDWTPEDFWSGLRPEALDDLERQMDDWVHERRLSLAACGPHALSRLSGLTRLQAGHLACAIRGRSWDSAESLREEVGLTAEHWKQVAPFVLLSERDDTAPANTSADFAADLTWSDLESGQQYRGLVVRAATFGLFVEFGLGAEALLHVSEMSAKFLADPLELAGPGESLDVEIASIDEEQRRVTLKWVSATGRAGRPSDRSRGGAKKHGASKASNSGKGKKRQGARSQRGGRPPRPKVQETRRKAPPTPLSEEMADGKAPLRSFSDLVQFYDRKKSEEDPPS